jgi:hypothetical protein
MLMEDWHGRVVDVKGAFLHGEFEGRKMIYMKAPSWFEKFYPEDVVLRLKKCIYGLKQAVMAFWQQLLICKNSMEMVCSTAYPCLYRQLGEDGLAPIVSWIDDNLTIGSKKAVEKAKKDLMERFDCKDCGDLEEYVGCKIEQTENFFKFTQPVLLQSYSDKFELPRGIYKTPA